MSKSDKTEPATAKKKRDSRQKGQVAKSQDLTAWTSLLVGLYLIPMTVGRMADVFNGALNDVRAMTTVPEPDATVRLVGVGLRDGFLAAAPMMLVVMLVSVVTSLAQTGPILTGKALKPDFKRVSPKQGIQRLFSVRSAWETGKQLLKMTIVIAIGWPRVVELVETLAGRGRLGFSDALPAAGAGALGLVRAITWTVFLLSLADYGYQRYQNIRDMRMTKQEVRDEHKQAEGDGSVKARMRAMQRSMARNRMITDMGLADVVITNPTHIAVALRYDVERGGAPRILASGAGSLAERIRERAKDAEIPIVEAKPLARALWRACDVGDEVPATLYEAVAKVLVFVRQLDRLMSASRPYDLPRASSVSEEQLAAIPRKRRRS
ncbi:MAG: flagellar biosynthetic protein FlhB [Candidatus Azotimanducaceae bacterium]|jgi:flagellar biosynthetic protein FlhB|tara:strand:+ start:26858 stop:27994 length:1137 start_codon:yes stop_codon:yes gene_type:complete